MMIGKIHYPDGTEPPEPVYSYPNNMPPKRPRYEAPAYIPVEEGICPMFRAYLVDIQRRLDEGKIVLKEEVRRNVLDCWACDGITDEAMKRLIKEWT